MHIRHLRVCCSTCVCACLRALYRSDIRGCLCDPSSFSGSTGNTMQTGGWIKGMQRHRQRQIGAGQTISSIRNQRRRYERLGHTKGKPTTGSGITATGLPFGLPPSTWTIPPAHDSPGVTVCNTMRTPQYGSGKTKPARLTNRPRSQSLAHSIVHCCQHTHELSYARTARQKPRGQRHPRL